MLNSVSIVGKLDSKIEFDKNERKQVEGHFYLKVKNMMLSDIGQEVFDIVPVTAWRGVSETLNDCAHIGSMIAIRGRIAKRVIHQDNGEDIDTVVVMAEVVEMLDKHFMK